MLTATIPQHHLHEALAPLDALTHEAILHAGPNGVVITATDPARITTITIRLEPTAFTTYEATGLTTGIDCTWLTHLLDTTTEPTTTLTLQTTSHNNLRITAGTLTATHTTIDPKFIHTHSLPHPTTQTTTLTLPTNSHHLELAHEATSLCTETITLDTTTGAQPLTCAAAGDGDTLTVTFTPDHLTTHNNTPTTATYPIDPLTTLLNALPDDDRPLTLTFAHNTPLRLHTPLANTHATATIHIAPHTN